MKITTHFKIDFQTLIKPNYSKPSHFLTLTDFTRATILATPPDATHFDAHPLTLMSPLLAEKKNNKKPKTKQTPEKRSISPKNEFFLRKAHESRGKNWKKLPL